ncbi:uncharacterized protein A1O9_07242 [Exophiala aquamarina CBS 119918]|uniref:Uncharacterized protein n=1 Tax=Exophiala aquamarina CBS 119918 TaxID=1182545 RepID=A0A072PBA1_9EURO|nr:uncharacterized protein A1O9_07242 [Exophiala aquamarina CBS 119918]KEF57052.1 hypothetical protein A1O9_07242 [Exophiala aquamarina CBS 119918]
MESNRSSNDYTPEELEAAAGFLQLFDTPIDFSPSSWSLEAGTESKLPACDNGLADTSIDSAAPLASTHPLPLTSTEPSSKTWFHGLLGRVPLKKFLRFGLRTAQLDAEGERRLEALLVEMPERSCVQEAAWYLEENKWNVNDAIAQYKEDEAARASQNSTEYQQALQAANTVTKQNFSHDLLDFRIKETVGTRRYTFPGAEEFDIDNPDHLRALNHWRADLARVRGPLPNIPVPTGTDKYWKKGEERYLQYRYANKKDEYAVGALPDMAKLVDELNYVTVGRYMPEKVIPCAGRTVTSANAWLDRTWKRDSQGNRIIHQQRYISAIKILNRRDEEQAEYDRFVN